MEEEKINKVQPVSAEKKIASTLPIGIRNKIRIHGGHHSNTIKLKIKSDEEKSKEINGAGLSISLKYVFGTVALLILLQGALELKGCLAYG